MSREKESIAWDLQIMSDIPLKKEKGSCTFFLINSI